MKKLLIIIGSLIVIALLGVTVIAAITPWMARWGATDEEVLGAAPGDELLAGTVSQTTRAIDIHTSASQVWPWLLQLGQGRGGLYSYDFLENLVGCNIHTLDSIDPDLQNLQAGDIIRLGPQEGLPFYKVAAIEAQRALILRSVNPSTGEMGETWAFILQEKSQGLTRLVIRHRTPPAASPTERVVNAIFNPISFVMERGMLFGLRNHAEIQ